MKRVILIISLFIAASCCSVSPLENKLDELDKVLNERSEYDCLYEDGINRLKEKAAMKQHPDSLWELTLQIVRRYNNCQVDSAKVFLQYLENLARADRSRTLDFYIEKANVLINAGAYNDAEVLLAGLDTLKMSQLQEANYYNTLLLLYAVQQNSEESLNEEQLAYYFRQRYLTRLKYLSCPGIDKFEKTRRSAIQMYEDGNSKEAIPILEALVESSPEEIKAHAAYSLAKACQAGGDIEMTKYWFAQGAIYNIMYRSGEDRSLYELSLILFGEHDFTRAVRYSRAALEESLSSNNTVLIQNSASSQLSILKAAEDQEAKHRKLMIAAIVLLAVLSLVIFAFWFITARQGAKIKDKAHQINDMNTELMEAGKIKEGYVIGYILLSAKYLGAIEEYRHDLRVTLKEEGVEALKNMIRQPSAQIQTANSKQFYDIFDKTFTGIYPNFLDKVNSLLKPEDRFLLHKDGEMPTGLRILALIRLGVSDSGNIAQFLNCAPSSVYTHRCKIKKSAICPPDEFEKRLMEIQAI